MIIFIVIETHALSAKKSIKVKLGTFFVQYLKLFLNFHFVQATPYLMKVAKMPLK